MIVNMKITPLRCPVCKKKILNKKNNRQDLFGCPKCGYLTKESEMFIDRKELKKRDKKEKKHACKH